MPKRKTPPNPSRFAPLFRRYLNDMIGDESQAEIAEAQGFAANTLSEQKSGKRPATIEMVDHVARHYKQTATQVLIALRAISANRDEAEPGWERPFLSPKLGIEGLPEAQAPDRAAALAEMKAKRERAAARRRDAAASVAKPKQAHTPSRRTS